MKIVFLGTGEFAVPSLHAVHRAGHEVSLVVSQPDRPKGRGLELKATAVKQAAQALGLRVFQPEKLRHESDPVLAESADVLAVVAYGQLLREDILGCAPRGAINVHASLLPKYRGAAPIQWALANGETVTGLTTMQLDRGMDTGPILLQEQCGIEPADTTATLEPRLALVGALLLVRTLQGLADGSVEPHPQDEARASRAPLIKKSDGRVDFGATAAQIANRLRGFSPWPGISFAHQGRAIKVLAASPLPFGSSGAEAVPGAILAISRDGVDVACGGGTALRLERVQPESRSGIAGADFANGAKLKVGEIFGSPAE